MTDRLHGGDGVPVIDVGTRIGPADAQRAELTNLAARHIYTLRGRLVDPDAIATGRHAYMLAPHLRIGRARQSEPGIAIEVVLSSLRHHHERVAGRATDRAERNRPVERGETALPSHCERDQEHVGQLPRARMSAGLTSLPSRIEGVSAQK